MPRGIIRQPANPKWDLQVPAMGLLDMGASTLRGAVTGALGGAGDLLSLVSEDQPLWTSEDVSGWLPVATEGGSPYEDIGGLIGLPVPAVGYAKTLQALSPEMAAVAENYLRGIGGIKYALPKGVSALDVTPDKGQDFFIDMVRANTPQKPDPGLYSSAQRKFNSGEQMSLEENVAFGLYPDVALKRKIPKPYDQYNFIKESRNNLAPRVVGRPEDLRGSALIATTGDRSQAGMNLLGIDDLIFDEAVPLDGGFDFMRDLSRNEDVWASAKGEVSKRYNRAKTAQGQGLDPLLMSVAQGHDSMQFNHMMTDTLYEMAKSSKITKKAIKEFDNEIRSIRPEWKGLMNPEARSQLMGRNAGVLRTVFNDRMRLKKFENQGFPNPDIARMAITEPELLSLPLNASGYNIGRVNLDVPRGPASGMPHKSYDDVIRGDYLMSMPTELPWELAFRDFFRQRRMDGKPESGDILGFLRSTPAQTVDQQWIDTANKYLEAYSLLNGQ